MGKVFKLNGHVFKLNEQCVHAQWAMLCMLNGHVFKKGF